jgi:aspartyl-tRNA(Asn)/glutamyl-tRNA(Gln) amidotransferase subunit A
MESTDGIFLAQPDAPAAGIPLAVKDLFDTAGLTTTYGSSIFADHVPAETATAVRLLEAAGYANVGKTNLHEFAYGVTSMNPHFGWVPNPVAPGRIAGGSSGGSAAALAAGLADAALGTDSGGSIRIPAACCGIAGFKPTYGLVPTDGIFPLAPSFDHAGPMARDVAGCIAAMRALVPGFAVREHGELRVGIAWLDGADPLVRAQVEAAAALLSPERRVVDFPAAGATMPVFMREVADVHRGLYTEQGELYGERIRPKIERCLAVTDAELQEGSSARADYRERALGALGDLDLLVTPTLGFVAPPADVDELAVREAFVSRTYAFNALGWPALAMPCGAAESGLPASIQLVGRPGTDTLVLAAGLALETALKP